MLGVISELICKEVDFNCYSCRTFDLWQAVAPYLQYCTEQKRFPEHNLKFTYY